MSCEMALSVSVCVCQTFIHSQNHSQVPGSSELAFSNAVLVIYSGCFIVIFLFKSLLCLLVGPAKPCCFALAFVPKIKRQVKFPHKGTPALPLQTTALGRALHRWITRCVRASSRASCAQRLCAVPRWDGRGVTPARCAQPSLIPAEEGSYLTTARELAKVKSVRCLFSVFVFIFGCLGHCPSLLLLSSWPVLTPSSSTAACKALPPSSPHLYPSSLL